jgi:hypothetical protein
MRSSFTVAAAALGFGSYHIAVLYRIIRNQTLTSQGSTAFAQLSEQCNGDICYQLNIPQSTADSGSGDIFIQIKAPASYQYVALGQGSSMNGANMFIMYQSADGTNVTVSPRTASGHNTPKLSSSADISLLEGSGVEGNTMTANIRCGSCSSWSEGSMDFSSSSASWIHATASGSPIKSDSQDASISQHGEDYGSFTWDFSNAKGGSEVNPLLSAGTSGSSASGSSSAAAGTASATCTLAPSSTLASVTGTSGCPTAWPTEYSTSWPTARPTWAAGCNPEGHGRGPYAREVWPTDAPWRHNEKRALPECEDGASPTGSNSQSDSDGSSNSQLSQNNRNGAFGSSRETMLTAHAVMASLAFLAFFPIGGILIRVASFTGLVWVHAALQIIGFLVYIVAFGIGIWIAVNGRYLTNAHPIIGIVLFIILFAQPLGGWLHHRAFKKYGRRTAASFAHIGIGRIAIVLGMVNGGLGLQLADAERSSVIAYAVVAAVMGLLYIASIVYGERKRSKRAPPLNYDSSQKEQISGRNYESSHGASYEIPPTPTGGQREYYSKRDSRR